MTKPYSTDIDGEALSRTFTEVEAAPYYQLRPSRSLIVLFTKDSLHRIEATLPALAAVELPIVTLDDSTNDRTRDWVLNQAPPNVSYHGPVEQARFLASLQVDGLSEFIAPLGETAWRLGRCRNYAVVLAQVGGFERVLLMDDDILIEDPNVIAQTLGLLDEFSIVGASTTGMPDSSLVDHIERTVGWPVATFISGQYLALNLRKVTHCFPDIYNEDWVFALMESTRQRLARHGGVEQLRYDPFVEAFGRATFQEFGEAICSGVCRAIALGQDATLLRSSSFWEDTRRLRLEELIELRDRLDRIPGRKKWREILSALVESYDHIGGRELQSFFASYLAASERWGRLVDALRDADHDSIAGGRLGGH